MDDRWPAGYAGLLAGTACHESEQLSQKKGTNEPKISRLLAPLGPAAAIANQRRCVVSVIQVPLLTSAAVCGCGDGRTSSDGKCARRESRLFQIRRSPDQRQRLLGRASRCVPITPEFSYR